MLGLRNVLQVFHVEADPFTAFVEGGLFFVGKRNFDHLFNAILTDQAGYARKETGFTKFTRQLNGGRENDLSSRKIASIMKAAVLAMPYSVQNLPENVTQPPPMASF